MQAGFLHENLAATGFVVAKNKCPSPSIFSNHFQDIDPHTHNKNAYFRITNHPCGGSRDKSVFLRCYWDFMRAKLVVEDELVFEPGTSNGIIAPALRTLLNNEVLPFWCDLPGQVSVDLRKDFGINVTLPTKIEADAALNALRVAFSRGQIEINPRCKFLIASLEGGAWNDKRTDYLRTEALGHCDAIDALIYAWRHRDEKNPYPNVYNPNVWTGGGKAQTANQDLILLAKALNIRRKHG